MKVAIIGSRTIDTVNLEEYLPQDTTEIVSGGAKGIDSIARNYALSHNIPLKEFLPQYSQYGKSAPLKRNNEIVHYCDTIIAFWDGISKGTFYTIKIATTQKKPVTVILC